LPEGFCLYWSCIITLGQRHAAVFSKDSYKVLIFVRSKVELQAIGGNNINGWPGIWP
jgi:hypothetical protein